MSEDVRYDGSAGPIDFVEPKPYVNKGTLTILNDTHVVLGLPHNYGYPSKDDMQTISRQLYEWLKTGGLLPLPFPVEVIDMRQKNSE